MVSEPGTRSKDFGILSALFFLVAPTREFRILHSLFLSVPTRGFWIFHSLVLVGEYYQCFLFLCCESLQIDSWFQNHQHQPKPLRLQGDNILWKLGDCVLFGCGSPQVIKSRRVLSYMVAWILQGFLLFFQNFLSSKGQIIPYLLFWQFYGLQFIKVIKFLDWWSNQLKISPTGVKNIIPPYPGNLIRNCLIYIGQSTIFKIDYRDVLATFLSFSRFY